MSSPASVAKHPIHPMLVAFPIGLLNFSLFADLMHHSGNGKDAWKEVANRSMMGGIAGALAAAVPGFVDYLSLKGRAKKIGTAHMAMNLSIVGLYGYNLWRRTKSPESKLPVALSAIGSAGLFVSGWLGGELVYVHGSGVESEEERKKAEIEEKAIPEKPGEMQGEKTQVGRTTGVIR
ncbi:MAG: DUF2231 domain-containing protein [Desulfobacteraceae bacterium]|nr:MAG: DUF2231 domain-containing protein [Desulfobacteraceae bacterium]